MNREILSVQTSNCKNTLRTSASLRINGVQSLSNCNGSGAMAADDPIMHSVFDYQYLNRLFVFESKVSYPKAEVLDFCGNTIRNVRNNI